MGQGDRHFPKPRAAGGLRDWPLFASAAFLFCGVALTGCGNATEPREAPRVPGYWQGSIEGPRPENWTGGDQWAHPPTPTNASRVISTKSPTTIRNRQALNETPQNESEACSGVDGVVSSSITRSEPETASNETIGGDGNRQGPSTESRDFTAGMLLPPQPASNSLEPAPTDMIVVDELPALTPPSPAAIAALDSRGATASVERSATLRREPVAAPAVAVRPEAAPKSSAAPAPASPTGPIVTERAVSKIRRGYELAERGAFFAARNQFVDVLRMIADAKDELHGAPRRTVALAEGLRALDEAADFTPVKGEAGADLKMSVIVASHQTPVAKSLPVDDMLPQQLTDAYLQYAERRLGGAVAGEPAGSMALHALGKLHSRLGRVEPEKNPQADAMASALQRAALLARPDNDMAAHELGVLLAESGHYVESDQLLRQVAVRAPHAVVYRNLARVERQLGRPDLAVASEQQAEYFAARGDGGNSNIQWVPVDALVGTPDALGPPATSPRMPAGPSYGPGAGVPMTARGPAPIQR